MTGHPAMRDGAVVKLPLFTSLRGYDSGWLRGGVVAGLTVWAVLVPEALAYASIAGVSPVVGLYAAPGALLLYAAFGSSRHLVVGPMSATAALSAAAVAAGVLRLGFLASFISEPVLKGFIIGLALTIVAGQLPDLLGVPAGDGDVFAQAGHLLSGLGDVDPWTAAIGLASLAALLGLRRYAPAAPAALLVVVGGIAVVALFDLTARGVEVIGEVDGAMPVPAFPWLGWDELVGLLPGAVAVAIIGYAESATVAESMADEHGYDVTPDRELRAVGIATSSPACSRASSPAAGPASRPPTTGPAPRPSSSRCSCPASRWSPPPPSCRCSATCPRRPWGRWSSAR